MGRCGQARENGALWKDTAFRSGGNAVAVAVVVAVDVAVAVDVDVDVDGRMSGHGHGHDHVYDHDPRWLLWVYLLPKKSRGGGTNDSVQ
jgi:hypothetical protein